MKVLLSILCVVGISSLATASVDPFDIIVLADKSTQSVVFRTTIPLDRTTDFEILSFRGDLLFQEELAPGSYLNKRFKSDAFPIGKYKVVISDERGKTELPVVFSHEGIITDRDLALRTHFPVIDLQENSRVLVVNCRNRPSNFSVSLRLTNQTGEEIFREEMNGNATVRRSYQLNQLAAGDYVVTISSEELKNYTAAITLR